MRRLRRIHAVHQMFSNNPSKSAATYWCDYFVGPDKVISTRHNYAQNPQQEWRRTWRFKPRDYWAAHEPPTLARPKGGVLSNLIKRLWPSLVPAVNVDVARNLVFFLKKRRKGWAPCSNSSLMSPVDPTEVQGNMLRVRGRHAGEVARLFATPRRRWVACVTIFPGLQTKLSLTMLLP